MRPLNNISFKNPLINTIFEIAQKKDIELYIVGGSVRDLLLGKKEFDDIDFIYQGDINQLKIELKKKIGFKIVPFKNKGFKTERFCFKNLILDFQPILNNDLLYDLKSRDFTINAMLLTKKESKFFLIDPLGGEKDLKERILKAVDQRSFENDPLRILRLYRFQLLYNLKKDAKSVELAIKSLPLLKNISHERIKTELIKIFSLIRKDILIEMNNINILTILFEENFNKIPDKFTNSYLTNLAILFYNNTILNKLPKILKKFTFSNDDIKTIEILKTVIEENNDDKIIAILRRVPLKFLENTNNIVNLILPRKKMILQKIIQNYKPLINGNEVSDLFKVKGVELGKIIEELHTIQIKYDIIDKNELLKRYRGDRI